MSPEEILELEWLAKLAVETDERGVEGDIVECGVYRGRSLCMIASRLPDRRTWAYDSFQGFPPASVLDGDRGEQMVAEFEPGEHDMMTLAAALHTVGVADENMMIRPGWFEDTFHTSPVPDSIAFLHVDCDLYASVSSTLKRWYGAVSPGGVVVLDDYGYLEGCRQAFYDWTAITDECPLLRTFGRYQAYWIKGEKQAK